MDELKKVFNIETYQELNDIHYIIVNEDKMKMPIGGRLSNNSTDVSSSIPIKFI